MPRKYGKDSNFKGNKNSGDKPDSVKFAEFVNMGYANYVVNDELKDLADKSIKDRDYKKVKDIAVEIAKRGIVEKKELTGKDGQPLVIKFDESFSKRNDTTQRPETDSRE